MNPDIFSAKALTIFLAFLISMDLLGICANAYFKATEYPDDTGSVYDLWNVSPEDHRLRLVENYLINNGWVKASVNEDELDHICLLTTQLSQFYDSLTPSLVLSLIAVESRFDQNSLSSGGDRGLMQLLPSYHEDRLTQFIEKDERYSRDLFYDPRLNIMTGMDYLSERIDECNWDIAYALMQYNQGPSSAYRTYMKKGITSNYAKEILELQKELDIILERS